MYAGMKVAFRVDASTQIGTGHVMRCLALADALCEQRARCIFVCRAGEGNMLALIAQRGHKVCALPMLKDDFNSSAEPEHAAWLGTDWETDVAQTWHALGCVQMDMLVVDHYALDWRWELALRPACRKLMVIDDLADRAHNCDLLLDQNLGRKKQDYGALLPANAGMLIGPQYALLRPEFAQWRLYSLQRRAQVQLNRLLIAMGGVDKNNITGQVLDVLRVSGLPVDMHVTVVMGKHAPWLSQVQEKISCMPWPAQLLVGVDNMAQIMADSDFAIGAAGGMSWERCTLGVPSLLFIIAENQKAGAMALQQCGAAMVASCMKDIPVMFRNLVQSPNLDRLRVVGAMAADVTDGQGVSRVVRQIRDCYVRD